MNRRKDSEETETTNGYMRELIILPQQKDLDNDFDGYNSDDDVRK